MKDRAIACLGVAGLTSLALLVGGASAAQAADPSPSPSATPRPATVVLTNADDGRSLTVPAGTEMEIDLTPARSGDVWSPAGDQRRNPIHDVMMDERGLTEHIRINASDSLSSRTDFACAHDASPCADSPQSWRVELTVPAGPVPDNPAEVACDSSVPSSSPGTRVITSNDNGRGVTVHQGDTVLVVSGCGTGDPVSPAYADTDLFRSRVSGTGGMHRVDTTFVARSEGRSSVQWQTVATCQPSGGQIYCYGRPDLLLRVTVTVVPADQQIDPADDQCVQSLTPVNYQYAWLAGSTVQLAGQADPGATVRIYFRRYDQPSFTLRRTVVADSAGHFGASYIADAPYSFFATAGTVCKTQEDHPSLRPRISGPSLVRRGSTVTLRVLGQPGSTVQILFRRQGQSSFVLRRTGRLDAVGAYATTYRADAGYRYQAHDATQALDGNIGLTQAG
jgi:hypothetical protein